MNDIGLDVRVNEGVTSTQLHDRWLELFHRRNDARRRAAAMWRLWKDTTEPVRARRLWTEYSAVQSEYRVLSAWTDLAHTAWVFATDGRECRLVTEEPAGRALVLVSS